ncbi:MAG: hypothetical protein JOS17DRAFT_159520 [Linnemannia elongata]|nr:MAG: hypothetical protein JOS17DRAFT_159520 [Linnemannia elongata]
MCFCVLSTFTEDSTSLPQTKPAQSHRVLVACPTHTTTGAVSVSDVSGSVYFWPFLSFCLAAFFSLLCVHLRLSPTYITSLFTFLYRFLELVPFVFLLFAFVFWCPSFAFYSLYLIHPCAVPTMVLD